MGRPETLEEVRKNRAQLIADALKKAAKSKTNSAAISTVSDSRSSSVKGKEKASGGQQVSTINVPQKRGKALTVVCWNVQTFTEGKAEANPVVSFIINKMLSKLDTDICILLETRENPSVNLAAVESPDLDEDRDEDDDSEGEQEEGDPDRGDDEVEDLKARVEELAAAPITYHTLASELTGKRFKPPRYIYPYRRGQKPGWNSRRFLKAYEDGKWKSKYDQLESYYDVYCKKNKKKITDLGNLQDDKFELRLKRCLECEHYYASSLDCEGCREFSNPGDGEALDRLKQSLGDLTYGFAGRVERETYAVLIRPASTDWTPPDGKTYLPGKDAELRGAGCKLLSADKHGRQLGFVDQNSTFYGRSPFLLDLWVKPIGASDLVTLPIAAFHAPFGAANDAGLKARQCALLEVLAADVGGTPFGDLDRAVLLGDLNLDAAAKKTTAQGRAFAAAAKGLKAKGFEQKIEATKSSLTTVYNTQKKKPSKRRNKYEGARWIDDTQRAKDAEVFTSSAYDNVFVKGQDVSCRAAVVDVIAWLAENIDDSALVEIREISSKEYDEFGTLTSFQKAFFVYRTFVSDHLPIVLDIAVECSNDDERAKFREHALRSYEETRLGVEVVYSKVLFAHVTPITRSFYRKLDESGSYLAIGQLRGVGSTSNAFVVTDGEDDEEEHEISVTLLTKEQLKLRKAKSSSRKSDDDDEEGEGSDADASLYSDELGERAWANGWWVAAYVFRTDNTGKTDDKLDTLLQRLDSGSLKAARRPAFFTPHGDQEAILFGKIDAVEESRMRVAVAEQEMWVPLENFDRGMRNRMRKGAYVVLVLTGYQTVTEQGT